MKSKVLFAIISSYLLVETHADDTSENGDRKAKLLFYPRTITKYVREKTFVTETIPSSCVVIPESLPLCRHAKQLPIEPASTIRIQKTVAPSLDLSTFKNRNATDAPRFLFGSEDQATNDRHETEKGKKQLSWAEYFGLEDVTVTKTAVHPVTAKFHDPNTVFSFNVKGCRPTALPFNLPLCPNNATSQPINTFSKEVHYAP